MKTKNGIELNLAVSEYKTEFANFIFYFSSKFYKNKFKESLTEYIDTEERKIKNKYKVDICLTSYLAISLYKKVEKRGFFVVSKHGEVINENVVFLNAIINH